MQAQPFTIRKAERRKVLLRMGISGPSGAGKTYTSLTFASFIAQQAGKRVLVIETEPGRSEVYATDFEFDVVTLMNYHPDQYIAALGLAAKEGYGVVVIDSLSHAWAGSGGVLEIVDAATKSSTNKNSYTSGWSVGTPVQNKLVEALIRAPFHIIATMRAKPDYVMEPDRNGKMQPRKVGVAAVQREDLEYEFTFYGMMGRDHALRVEKSDCRAFAVGDELAMPGVAEAQILWDWMSGASNTPYLPPERRENTPQPAHTTSAPSQPQAPSESPPGASGEAMVTQAQIRSIEKLTVALGRSPAKTEGMTFAQARDLLTELAAAYSSARQSDGNAPGQPTPTKSRIETICDSVGLGKPGIEMLFTYEGWEQNKAGVAAFLARMDSDTTLFHAQLEVFAWAEKHQVNMKELAAAVGRSAIKQDDPAKWAKFNSFLHKDDTDILLAIEAERPRRPTSAA